MWLAYSNGTPKDDSCGWKSRMRALAGMLPDDELSGILLTGPDGCGKHTCAAQFANAVDEDRFDLLCFNATLLCGRDGGGINPSDFISAVLDDTYDRKRGLVMVLELPDAAESCDAMLDTLASAVCEFHVMRDEYPPLILVLIKSDPTGIPQILRERLMSCHMTYPDKAQRLAFLQSRAKSLKKYVSFEKVAEITDGYSYRSLLDLYQNAAVWIDAQDAVTMPDEVLQTLVASIAEQRPSDKTDNSFHHATDKHFKELTKALNRIAEKRPQPAGTESPERNDNEVGASKNANGMIIDINAEAEKSMTMPVIDLQDELFGKEFSNRVAERVTAIMQQ